jgi:hypothetical protein
MMKDILKQSLRRKKMPKIHLASFLEKHSNVISKLKA